MKKKKYIITSFVLALFALAGCEKKQSSDQAASSLIAALEAKTAERNLEAIKARKVRISMTQSDVMRSLGYPDNRERVTDPQASQFAEEMWTYSGSGYYVCFGYDGKVVACSNSIDFDK